VGSTFALSVRFSPGSVLNSGAGFVSTSKNPHHPQQKKAPNRKPLDEVRTLRNEREATGTAETVKELLPLTAMERGESRREE
jgi:hypothetical protein